MVYVSVSIELCKRHGHEFYLVVQFDSNNIINNNNKKNVQFTIFTVGKIKINYQYNHRGYII